MIDEGMIGQRIAQLRQAKNFSRAEFADMMAVSAQAVGKWERGESLPDIITLKHIAQVLDCHINDFFVDESEPNPKKKNDDDTQSEADGQDDGKKSGFGKELKGFIKNVYDMSMSNWRDGDFSGLSNIADKFKYSNVINCKFNNSVLDDISFKGNSVKNCDFSGSSLKDSRFNACNINGTSFVGCVATNVVIKSSNVRDCDLTKSSLTNGKILNTAFFKNTIKDTNFDYVEFKNTSFENIVFESDIAGASFIGCTFKNTHFENLTLTDVFFKNCLLKKPKFVNCKVTKMTYSFLKSCKCDLTSVQIIEPKPQQD